MGYSKQNGANDHKWLKWSALIVFSAVTLAFHYGLFKTSLNVGDLFRRLCYVPILMGAFWFGVKGGMSIATGISLAVIPRAMHVSHSGGDLDRKSVV